MPLNVVRHEAEHLYAREPRRATARGAIQAVLHLHRAEEVSIERVRKASGLGKNEFHAMRYLMQAQRENREMGPKDLIVMLGLSSAAVTKIVDHLVDLGHLTRTPHKTDRRAWILQPTSEGAENIERSYGNFHTSVVEVMEALSPDDAATVEKVLSDVIKRLESADRQ
jgi:DNA-binding MarR family transcriptional regulator